MFFCVVAVTFAAPINKQLRRLQQAEDDGLQFADDDEGEADDDVANADDDYFFGDDDLSLIRDDDDGQDDDDLIVSFPPNTSDYETHGTASITGPAILVISLIAMIMF